MYDKIQIKINENLFLKETQRFHKIIIQEQKQNENKKYSDNWSLRGAPRTRAFWH